MEDLANIIASKEIEIIGTQAVKKVQEDNRDAGVPNVYSVDGKVFYEVDGGKITTENPFNIIKTSPEKIIEIDGTYFSSILTDEEINKSIARDALAITTTIQIDKYDMNNVVFAVMLDGGTWYSSRLFNRLQGSAHAVEYVMVSNDNGKVKVNTKTNKKSFKGKNVIIIEGFSNRGTTIGTFKEWLENAGAKTVDVCLMIKRKSLEVKTINEPLNVEDDTYIIGCGLEFNGRGRNLNLLYIK